jgi:hypothetical protein
MVVSPIVGQYVSYLYIYFVKFYNSVRREIIRKILIYFDILKKLVKLIKINLN